MLTSGWHAKPSIEDYAERNAQQFEWWKAQNGQLAGTAPSWRARTDLCG